MDRVSLSTPWIGFVREIYIIFGQDPEINMIYDDKNIELKIYVNNAIKADAMTQILPAEKSFGNIVLKVSVIPSNNQANPIDLFRNAFAGNPVLSQIIVDDSPTQIGMTHVVFDNKVVQYFNDCLNDPNGLESTLYEDIANDIFVNRDGVFFNTEASDDLIIWP